MSDFMLTHKAAEVDEAIGVVLKTCKPKRISLTLSAANWIDSGDSTYYTQDVTIDGSTVNTKVDLDPTPEQYIQLLTDEITMFVGNDNGIIKAYSIGGKPEGNMTISALISEVVYA